MTRGIGRGAGCGRGLAMTHREVLTPASGAARTSAPRGWDRVDAGPRVPRPAARGRAAGPGGAPGCAARHSGRGNIRERRDVINYVSTYIDAAEAPRPANLVLVEQSGAKHEIPQSSPGDGMIEAEQVMHDPALHLREVKVVSEHRAIARWKASELGWRRVA